MTKDLTIELVGKGEKLTVASLIEALERALAVLRGMDPSQDAWEIVRVKMNSPLKITVRNKSATPTAATTYMRALNRIAKKPIVPLSFSERELAATERFAEILDNGIQSIKLSFPGERSVRFTPELARNVKAINKRVSGKQHYEFTTLEGLLDQVTVREGHSKFRITDLLTGRLIDCNFQPDELERVKSALPHRVSVTGRAKFNATGEPTSIEVEELQKLRDRSSLPQFDDLSGINIADGEDAADYVRRVRGGE